MFNKSNYFRILRKNVNLKTTDMKNQTSIKETIEEIFKFIAKFRLMNQASIRIKTAAFIATILGCFFYNISVAQYSLRPRITEFLTDEQDFRKNEMLRSQEYQGKNNNLFLELLRKENELRNLYKDFTFKFNDREYRYEHTKELIDTIFKYVLHNKDVLSESKTSIDSLIYQFENSEVFNSKIKPNKDKYLSVDYSDYLTLMNEVINLIPETNSKLLTIMYFEMRIRTYNRNIMVNKLYELIYANYPGDYRLFSYFFPSRNEKKTIELLILAGDCNR